MNSPRSGRPALARPDGTPVHVLVVDDDPDLAEVLSGALRYEGWNVRTAGDGATAVAEARTLMPDAVVLDVMLPDTDGFAVLKSLRSVKPDVC
ncbi:MAG: response regulator, partial [Streptomyces sp.]|nr:response regulator [Streptomyces sp.]